MNDFEKQIIGRLLYENIEFELEWSADEDRNFVTAIHSSASAKKWWRLVIYSEGDYTLRFAQKIHNNICFNADHIINTIKEEI